MRPRADRGIRAVRLLAGLVAALGLPAASILAANPAAQQTPDSDAIRLIQPALGDLAGKVRFRTLIACDDVERVVFFLDGVEAAVADKPPYAALIDLGPQATPRSLAVEAWTAAGELAGRDEVRLNQGGGPVRLRIREIAGDPDSGSVTVSAGLDTSAATPPAIERLEFFWRDQPRAVRRSPPFRAQIATPPASAGDYVRVVATLTDGSIVETARLLGEPGDRVSVNLVEIRAQVRERRSQTPVRYAREDFVVVDGEGRHPVERLTAPHELPLHMGFALDASDSMRPWVDAIRGAGDRLVRATLSEDDLAFVVRFADGPRLAEPVTGDLQRLLGVFSDFEAGGDTALYDAVLFSLLQFEGVEGRKALVALTDGDDFGSRFEPDRCAREANRLGVPLFFVTPGPPPDLQRSPRRLFNQRLAAATGGRVFYFQSEDELERIALEIDRHLDSQYLLTYSAERPLTAAELEALEVEIDGCRRCRVAVQAGSGY